MVHLIMSCTLYRQKLIGVYKVYYKLKSKYYTKVYVIILINTMPTLKEIIIYHLFKKLTFIWILYEYRL